MSTPRTPEQIADEIAHEFTGRRDEVTLSRDDFRAALTDAAREAQTKPATVTTSGDRYEAARKLADHLEEKMKTAQWMTASEGTQAVHALRALIATQAAPTFKPENLDRDARLLTAAARLISDAAHLREISYAGHPAIKEKIADTRRILEMLSSEDADQ